ncbi:MAG: hypothetical protein LAT84_11485 [Balneolia bacterium]|nr:hypothetical protein [Balneolia bacterium]
MSDDRKSREEEPVKKGMGYDVEYRIVLFAEYLKKVKGIPTSSLAENIGVNTSYFATLKKRLKNKETNRQTSALVIQDLSKKYRLNPFWLITGTGPVEMNIGPENLDIDLSVFSPDEMVDYVSKAVIDLEGYDLHQLYIPTHVSNQILRLKILNTQEDQVKDWDLAFLKEACKTIRLVQKLKKEKLDSESNDSELA